jgi:hypothetical protein
MYVVAKINLYQVITTILCATVVSHDTSEVAVAVELQPYGSKNLDGYGIHQKNFLQ